MRNTLDIDKAVLLAAKKLARQQRVPVGRLVSRLLRQSLTGQAHPGGIANWHQPLAFERTHLGAW
ncbi:MAG: hypothetical protein ABTR07_00235 [Candidatus Competibacter denitrificans]